MQRKQFINEIKEVYGYDIGLNDLDVIATMDGDYTIIQHRRIRRIREMTQLDRNSMIRALRLFRHDVNIHLVPSYVEYVSARTYLEKFNINDFDVSNASVKDLEVIADTIEQDVDFLTPGAYNFLSQYIERKLYKKQTGYNLGERLSGDELTEADKYFTDILSTLHINITDDMSLEQRELLHGFVDAADSMLTPNMQQYLHDKIEL